MRMSDVLIRMIGARDPNCPNEADVLAYSEGRRSSSSRARLERHFAECDDCRQVLVFLGRESVEAVALLTEEAVSAQTNSVLAYIQTDERNRSKPAPKTRAAAGFYISYPRLASVGLVICAIVVASIFMITSGRSAADAAMDALKVAVKDARYTEARVSGGFNHSRFTGRIRGEDRYNDALHFDRAENKVKTAAGVEARLMLARVYLARGEREYTKRAIEILDQLAKSGIATPEALNDTGVAHLELYNYSEAITYFTRALSQSPGYYEALFNKALAEEGDHRYDDAKRDWQAFIDKSSDDSWKNEAREKLGKLNERIR